MDALPSVGFFPSASYPEVIWILASFIAVVLTAQGWVRNEHPREKLKNFVRFWASLAVLINGLIAATTPPPVLITWLSTLTPMTLAFSAFSMALLTTIDRQGDLEKPLKVSKEESTPQEPVSTS